MHPLKCQCRTEIDKIKKVSTCNYHVSMTFLAECLWNSGGQNGSVSLMKDLNYGQTCICQQYKDIICCFCDVTRTLLEDTSYNIQSHLLSLYKKCTAPIPNAHCWVPLWFYKVCSSSLATSPLAQAKRVGSSTGVSQKLTKAAKQAVWEIRSMKSQIASSAACYAVGTAVSTVKAATQNWFDPGRNIRGEAW